MSSQSPRSQNFLISLLTTAIIAVAGVNSFGQKPAPAPAADPKDVATVDSIIAAVYDVISGPVGQEQLGSHALALRAGRAHDSDGPAAHWRSDQQRAHRRGVHHGVKSDHGKERFL